ncbi:MAG: transporter substrate-binding domain-containing protein [Deltaproteobacteria bacterium]|jgi:polar amino acid transport system substrate-binding protein|nr:transporter substrate-binding domain-containing protein [Deltaproteobacteria bacterium]MBT4527702.1 transporter substrate-binding domain-containing protein [Deltaproteobacteria bacterium]
MNKLISLLLTLILAISMATVTLAEDTLSTILKRGELLVGTEAGYMPFEMRNNKGEIVGFDMDMMAAAAKAMGVKLTLINTNWDGIIPALLTRKFDIIAGGMTITQSRNLKVNFANPYISVGQTILLKKGLGNKVKSYKSLNKSKYTIASKLGTTGEQAAKRMIPRAKYISYDTEQEGSMEVISGKIDAFIYDLPFQAIMYNDKGKGKVTHLDKPFTFEPLGWAVRKGDPDFLNWLNNFLYQAKHDGTYDKIYAKWFKSTEWKKDLQ